MAMSGNELQTRAAICGTGILLAIIFFLRSRSAHPAHRAGRDYVSRGRCGSETIFNFSHECELIIGFVLLCFFKSRKNFFDTNGVNKIQVFSLTQMNHQEFRTIHMSFCPK
jgi:hypothetical protein